MARPKKEDVDEITAVNKDIEAQKEKLKKLQEKQKRLQEADNIKLGKLVKSIFKDSLPVSQEDRKKFFLNLVKSATSIYDEEEGLSVEADSDADDVTGDNVVVDAAMPGQIVE